MGQGTRAAPLVFLAPQPAELGPLGVARAVPATTRRIQVRRLARRVRQAPGPPEVRVLVLRARRASIPPELRHRALHALTEGSQDRGRRGVTRAATANQLIRVRQSVSVAAPESTPPAADLAWLVQQAPRRLATRLLAVTPVPPERTQARRRLPHARIARQAAMLPVRGAPSALRAPVAPHLKPAREDAAHVLLGSTPTAQARPSASHARQAATPAKAAHSALRAPLAPSLEMGLLLAPLAPQGVTPARVRPPAVPAPRGNSLPRAATSALRAP